MTSRRSPSPTWDISEKRKLEAFVSESLKSPLDPLSGCFELLYNAIGVLWVLDENGDLRDKDCFYRNGQLSIEGDTMRNIIRFLSTRRTSDDMVALDQRIAKCRCNRKELHIAKAHFKRDGPLDIRREIEPTVPAPDTTHLDALAKSLSEMTALYFIQVIDDPMVFLSPSKKNGKSPWPSNFEDAIIGSKSLGELMAGLLCWYPFGTLGCVISLLGAKYLSIYGSRLEPGSPMATKLVANCVKALSATASGLFHRRTGPDERKIGLRDLSSCATFVKLMLDDFNNLASTQVALALADKIVYDLICSVVYKLHLFKKDYGAEFSGEERALLKFCDMFEEYIRVHRRLLDAKPDVGGDPRLLSSTLSKYRRMERCSRYGCTWNFDARQARLCSGCGLATFCGAEVRSLTIDSHSTTDYEGSARKQPGWTRGLIEDTR